MGDDELKRMVKHFTGWIVFFQIYLKARSLNYNIGHIDDERYCCPQYLCLNVQSKKKVTFY